MVRTRVLAVAAFIVGFAWSGQARAGVIPTDGMVITSSTVLEPGEYFLPNGISIGASFVEVSAYDVVIRGAGTGNGLLIGDLYDARRAPSGGTLKGGTFTGFAVGLRLANADGAVVQDAAFDGNVRGGYLDGWRTIPNEIRDCSFSDNVSDGLWQGAFPAGRYTGLQLRRNGGFGAFLNWAGGGEWQVVAEDNVGDGVRMFGWWMAGTVVRDSVFRRNQGTGAFHHSAPGVTYRNTVFEDNGGNGLYFYGGSKGIRVEGSTVRRNRGTGVGSHHYGGDCTVTSTAIHDNLGEGVRIAGDEGGWNVHGNDIHDNKGAGVMIEAWADGQWIHDNEVRDNCGPGVSLYGATARHVIEHNDVWANGACTAGRQLTADAPFDAGVNGAGNYWGRRTAPGILPGIDTNASWVTDSRAWTAPSGWIDGDPPATTITLAGPPGLAGWYVGPVTVRFDATDAVSGVALTEYRLDGSKWIAYAGPFQVAGDGMHLLEFRSTDAIGNVEPTQSVELRIDGTPPELTVTTAVAELWPVDHRLVDVGLAVTASDALDPAPTVEVELESSEGENAHEPDWVLQGDALQLRAERDGTGAGRTYTIVVTATDEAGNAGFAQAQVLVPHDQGR